MGYVIRYFKDMDLTLADIDVSDLRDFMNSLYEHEKQTHAQRNKIGLSDRYIRDIMVLVKQVFKYYRVSYTCQMTDPVEVEGEYAAIKDINAREFDTDDDDEFDAYYCIVSVV